MSFLETTELLGNLGEFIGSLAVLITLIVLVLQVRQNSKALQESNVLQRASTVDRHADTVGEWRLMIAGSTELASIWHRAENDLEMTDEELMRYAFMFITFVNMQRSNFNRAMSVGEEGLAQQAIQSVAAQVHTSKRMRVQWDTAAAWTQLASPAFVKTVNDAIEGREKGLHDELLIIYPHQSNTE